MNRSTMQPLPIELERFSLLQDLAYRGNGEWSSACPTCGGGGKRFDKSDRLRLFAASAGYNARVWCRRCGHFEWADQNTNARPDPVKIQEAKELRVKLAEQEAARLRAKIDELKTGAYWKGYHDAMQEPHRALWRQAGIPNEFQDYWELGFVNEKRIKYDGKDYTSPAMSIPYFKQGREPINIQYRLTNPPIPSDKYRFSYGLKPDLWLAEPDSEPRNACLLMEGMKKAAVTFIEVVVKARQQYSVVAAPSKTPGQHMIENLSECDVVYVVLDPDAYVPAKMGKATEAQRLGEMLGDRARFVRLPDKADDLFIDYDFDVYTFMQYMRTATKVA